MKTLLMALTISSALLAQDTFRVKVTGHGQAMILIPGLSSSGEVWDSTVAHYQDRFECHVLTVAGFAGVPRVPAPMLERVRDALAAYMREKKLAQPVLAGHSLGGFLALAVATKHPDLAGKLVIVDAYPFFGLIFLLGF
jgi:pimeloyl-ACP methyl ester carboxylesterase